MITLGREEAELSQLLIFRASSPRLSPAKHGTPGDRDVGATEGMQVDTLIQSPEDQRSQVVAPRLGALVE